MVLDEKCVDSWTDRKTNKWVIDQIHPELSVGTKMMKLKSFFMHTVRSQDSLEKIIMLEKVEGSRKTGRSGMR